MVKKTASVKSIIFRYKEQLESMGIHCKRILLFGSHAEGLAREGSDIDLIIISDDLKKLTYLQRLEILGIAAARIIEPIQAVGFTTDEIKKRKILPMWEEIVRNALKAA